MRFKPASSASMHVFFGIYVYTGDCDTQNIPFSSFTVINPKQVALFLRTRTVAASCVNGKPDHDLRVVFQVRVCEEMSKLFYDKPTQVWTSMYTGRSSTKEAGYYSEYQVLESWGRPFPTWPSGDRTYKVTGGTPFITANQWKGIFEMCRLSR